MAKPMANQILGLDRWARHEEEMAMRPDLVSVGIGNDAAARIKLTREQLGAALLSVFHDLIDGGANLIDAEGVRLYVRRRKNNVDIGTRQDFADLGWQRLCDELDRNEKAERRR
jgi:hypothetical protein